VSALIGRNTSRGTISDGVSQAILAVRLISTTTKQTKKSKFGSTFLIFHAVHVLSVSSLNFGQTLSLIKTNTKTVLFVCLFVFSPLYCIALASSPAPGLAEPYISFEDTSRVND